jgi:hypothetical protein
MNLIDSAKEFGGTDGHKYANAVLNQLALQLRATEMEADRKNPASGLPTAATAVNMRITQRARRIEPFYVMEMAKAAQRIANEVKHTERPMVFLNIGEPDFTAPPWCKRLPNALSRMAARNTPMP